MRKPILVLDWDGVVHSYASGWKGATVIPDPPVPGALEFIFRALDTFDVHILSSRSHQWGGRRAMKRYLKRELERLGNDEIVPAWWKDYICKHSAMEPWYVTVSECADRIVGLIKWPLFKPPAAVTLDDRGMTFTGTWPSISELVSFKPWNKRT